MTNWLNLALARALRAVYKRRCNSKWKGSSPPAVNVSNLQIMLSGRKMPLRMYHGDSDAPLLVYFHGGGWVIGDFETHDPFCRSLSHASGCSIITPDYRLAPEHKFPAAHDDCLLVAQWASAKISDLAPNDGQLILAGDSAGGNLAMSTALSMKYEKNLKGCLIIYPATQHYISDLPSYTEHARSSLITARTMRWFCDTYLGKTAPANPSTERLFPRGRTSFTNFPPTLLITAERDPLRDDGKRFAVKLHQAGVKLTYRHMPDAAHGLICSEGPSDSYFAAVKISSQWLASKRLP